MLKEFLQNITGPVSNIAFTYPSGTGVGGPTVGPKGIFNKLLNVLSNGAYNGGGSNFLGGYTTMLPQGQNLNPAVQAYTNSLSGGQGFPGVVNQQYPNREAFSPGAVINTLQAPPSPQTYSYSQLGQLATGINPLQGFANSQTTGITPGAIPGAVTGSFGTGSLMPGQMQGAYSFPGGFSMPGASGLGKWSMFLMPLIGLLGFVKSLFGLRGAGAMQPVQIDKEALDYKISLEKFGKEEHTDGSFDDSYWGDDERSESDFDPEGLEM